MIWNSKIEIYILTFRGCEQVDKRKSLKSKAIGGILWSFGDKLANQGIQFIIQIILARLLLPEHFGLIGLILVFVAVSTAVVDSGFTQALIREKTVSQKDYSTVFYYSMAVAVLMYVLLFLAAPWISRFFEEPQMAILIRVVSLGIIILSFSNIPRAMYARDVDFKPQAKVNMISSVFSGAAAVLLALNGFGIWSLIARTLVMNLLQSVLFLWTKKWLPSLVFSASSFQRLFGFGWKLMISTLLTTIYQNIYFLIIGKQFSTTQLGYFTNASKFSDLISQTLTSTIQRVAYPILSSIQDEEERLKGTYKRIIRLSAFMLFPVMAGLAAIGEPLVAFVFGEQWMPMVAYFQLLCLASMLYPIHTLNLSVLQVKGRSDLFLKLEVVKIAVSLLSIAAAIWMGLNVLGFVGIVILNSYIALFINTYFSGREISYPLREQLKDLLPTYLVSLLMGIAVFGIGQMLPQEIGLQIILQVGSGIVLYILFSKLVNIPEMKMASELLMPILKRIKRLKPD